MRQQDGGWNEVASDFGASTNPERPGRRDHPKLVLTKSVVDPHEIHFLQPKRFTQPKLHHHAVLVFRFRVLRRPDRDGNSRWTSPVLRPLISATGRLSS